jgi:protein SCO1
MSTPSKVQRLLQDLTGRPVFWVLFLIAAFTWPIARSIGRQLPPPLPVLGALPQFALTSEQGRPFGSRDLRGKVWVADFIFTRCPTICPLLTQTMGQVQHRARNLGDAFHIVSFSVDPAHDTPARLARYAGHHRVSPRMWTFLTGSLEDVERTVVQGLKVSMGREASGTIDRSDFASIFHGTHFVLVDQELRIRGYYDSSEQKSIDRLMRDIGTLVNHLGDRPVR